ncbi:hypothetical protein HUT18_32390 [Streptomyces sp. NA04227]|uniref:DUF6153 family protein n=1 Tax=Streptomyces sp. NA04227 TaxID=2742136 RepID=UPI00159013D3|nr:DUF6153 family protein [Streptomyces sp. NA04227]QKW10416.1 hypothetical protein HUT18_32390 [Streptomyces sp. NA04227]
MSRAPKPSKGRPSGRSLTLLVLAVLAGLLAMHGLGPGPGPGPVATPPAAAAGQHGAQGAAHHAMADPGSPTGAQDARPGVDAQRADADCSHTEGGTGHLAHADAMCAATGVGTSYAPPALAASCDGVPALSASSGRATDSAEHGRAPPDLSELQLLRI